MGTGGKKQRTEGVVHTFDSNGSLVVNAYSLLMSPGIRRQLAAAEAILARAKSAPEDEHPSSRESPRPSL